MSSSGGPVDRTILEDVAAANRILVDQGVFDAAGHVSLRHPGHAERFLMSRGLAPQMVTADDIMEFDLDGNAVDARGRSLFLERFIHSEIYRARPDVMSVVHTHSPGVIPYTISQVPLRAVFHNAAFLAAGAPIWDIRKAFGETDMLVRDVAIGKDLALTLGDKSVVLMRGHGDVTVGPSVKLAVFRAYYTEVNARLQAQAIGLGGPVTYLTPEESAQFPEAALGGSKASEAAPDDDDMWSLHDVAVGGSPDSLLSRRPATTWTPAGTRSVHSRHGAACFAARGVFGRDGLPARLP